MANPTFRDVSRERDIRISFHHDILDEFSRIHHLVNHANELNFTKVRWPDDPAEARKTFALQRDFEFETSCGYIKMSDRRENHGIVGFYMRRKTRCGHFLFSSRVLNMGVEQFVWQRLGKPAIKIMGEVAAALGATPDWITVVDDADHSDRPSAGPPLTLCLRGACDLAVTGQYLRPRYDIIEETQYPCKGWNVLPVARCIALRDELDSDAGRRLAAALPAPLPDRFDSAVRSGGADAYVLSFASEIFPRQYRSKSTGLIIPLSNWQMNDIDYRAFTYDQMAKNAEKMGMTRAQWEFMRADLVPHASIDFALLARDARIVMEKLRGKLVIVLKINTRVGADEALLATFNRINESVLPVAREFGAVILDAGDHVKSVADLRRAGDRGTHYTSEVYQGFAMHVNNIIVGGGNRASLAA